MRVLGVNVVCYDPAAALGLDSQRGAAAEQEEFFRREHGKRPVALSTWERA